MKKALLTLTLSVSFILSSFAQRNYAQELINLLQQGRAFEAMEFREQYADKLPLNDRGYDLFYKANMALFFNQTDSAATYLEDLLAIHELKIGPAIGIYYSKLLMVYDSQQRFNGAMGLCDQYMNYLRRNPFDMNPKFIQNEIKNIEDIKKAFRYKGEEPRIKTERDNPGEDKVIGINDSEFIRFNAKYNNLTAETWFDTGVPTYFMMTRTLAGKIGTKLIDGSRDSVQVINGVSIRGRVEVVDSISIGGIKLYNIPVLIFNEPYVPYTTDSLDAKSKLVMEKTFRDRQIVMGVSAMKLIGRIDFDLERRTASFPAHTVRTASNDSSNIFFADRNLYIRLKVGGAGYVGYLNTGSDCSLRITSSFYEKNKKQIETDFITQKKASGQGVISGDSFSNIHLDVELINHKNGGVVISDTRAAVNVFDGIAGVNLFKSLGSKIMFDFNNMRMEVSD